MKSQVIIDTETTGLDGRPAGFTADVVEIGLVAISETGEELFSDAWYVRQPDSVLDDPRATSAFNLTGIDRDVVRSEGISVTDSQQRLIDNLSRAQQLGVECVRAFNQQFDFGILSRNGFHLDAGALPRGECIMLAAMGIMGPLGVLPPASDWVKQRDPNQLWKWPRLTEVIAWLNGRGHAIRWSTDAHHRALTDARLEALVAWAIDREATRLSEGVSCEQ